MGMFDGLKQLGDLNQMRQQAAQIQRELAAEKVEVVRQTTRGLLKIILTGEQKVVEASYDGQRDSELESVLSEVLQKSQMVAAAKLQQLSGGLGGLLGK